MAKNRTTRPTTLSKPARMLSDAQIAAEDAWLGRQWDKLRDALEESGGASGSPGEWIWERLGELETEAKRRSELAEREAIFERWDAKHG